MNTSNDWRLPVFRTNVAKKIEEEITKLGISMKKSSQQLENEEYEKASTKEQYLKLIAQLIYCMRRSGSNEVIKQETFDSINSPASSKDLNLKRTVLLRSKFKSKSTSKDKPFICAVCCSSFPSKRSIMNHIKSEQHTIAHSLPDSVLGMIPQQWIFTLCTYFKMNGGYKMEICLPSVNEIEQTQEWMSEFMKRNQCAYAWERTTSNENRTKLEVVYCCQYGEKRVKCTCKSKISFMIKRGKLSYTTANIDFVHDHSMIYSDDARHCNPSAEVKQILFKYFENASNPIDAFRNFQIHIEMQLNSESEYLEYIADRRKMPVLSWVRQRYSTEYQPKSLTMTRDDLDLLKKFIDDKNEEYGECLCKFQELPNNNFVVFIVTAYMKRALKSQAASELIYTESIGSTVQFGLKVYLLLTNIRGEAVPLAVMVTSSETNKAIKTGFNLLSASIDDQSFNSKGRIGPAIIMTDDSIAEMASMKSLFPYSKIVLSTYHFLHACYKWLTKIEHKISKLNREIIYAYIRRMVYAENETILRTLFDELVEMYKTQEVVSNYVFKLYVKRQTWALCYRRNFVSMESHPNTWKRTICILKEQISNRIKFQEPKRLISYFFNEFSDFYSRRLIDCALNRYADEHCVVEDQMKDYEFIQRETCESFFILQNRLTGVKYLVNTDINYCTCYLGFTGALCEHQKILTCFIGQSDTEDGNDTETKLELYYIVSGCKDVPEEFFGLSNQNALRNFTGDSQNEQFFDSNVREETIIDDTFPQKNERMNEKFVHEVEIQQNVENHNIRQVYPIIISNEIQDESIVKIDESCILSDNIRVESAPRIVLSIEGNIERNAIAGITDNSVIPLSSQLIDAMICETLKDEIEDSSSMSCVEEDFNRELIMLNEHLNRIGNAIKQNPDHYKSGLLYLNKELFKVKQDPVALLRALSNFKVPL